MFVIDKCYCWNLRVVRTYCCYWGCRSKTKIIFHKCFCCRSCAVDDEIVLPIRLRRDRATQDTDKPEIQPVSERVSEPESFPDSDLGQL